MAKKINIAAELNAATVDGKLADASQIYDSKKGKFQEKINEEIETKVDAKFTELEQQIGNDFVDIEKDVTYSDTTGESVSYVGRSRTPKLIYNRNSQSNALTIGIGVQVLFWRDNVYLGYSSDSLIAYDEQNPTHIAFCWKTYAEDVYYSPFMPVHIFEDYYTEVNEKISNTESKIVELEQEIGYPLVELVANKTYSDTTGEYLPIDGRTATPKLRYHKNYLTNALKVGYKSQVLFWKDSTYLGFSSDSLTAYDEQNPTHIAFCWEIIITEPVYYAILTPLDVLKNYSIKAETDANFAQLEQEIVKSTTDLGRANIPIIKDKVYNNDDGTIIQLTGGCLTDKLLFNEMAETNALALSSSAEVEFWHNDIYLGYSRKTINNIEYWRASDKTLIPTHIAFCWGIIITEPVYYTSFVVNNQLDEINNQLDEIDNKVSEVRKEVAVTNQGIDRLEENVNSINSEVKSIQDSLSKLDGELPQGAITGDNVWTGKNTFAQSVEGVPGTKANSMVVLSQLHSANNSHRYINALDFGFDPNNDATTNTNALNTALLGGNKTVVVTKPGVYQLSATILLYDNTELICAKGVILQKSSSYVNMFRNEGAKDRRKNYNITLRGLTLDIQRIGAWAESDKLYGLRGELAFLFTSNVRIYDFYCDNLLTFNYGITFNASDNFIIDTAIIGGEKDGIHISSADSFMIRNCRIKTHDDAIALNASDWISSNCVNGSITNGLIENIIDEYREGTTGYLTRLLVGAYVDWYRGMSIKRGDTVINNGRMYRAIVNTTSGTEYFSMTEPTINTFEGVQEDAGGFSWKLMRDDKVFYNADIKNVLYRNIQGLSERTAFAEEVYTSGEWDRGLHPSVPISSYPTIDIRVEGGYLPKSTGIIVASKYANTTVELTGIRASKNYQMSSPINESLKHLLLLDKCDMNSIDGGTLIVNASTNTDVVIGDKMIYNDVVRRAGEGHFVVNPTINLSSLPTFAKKGDWAKVDNTPYVYTGTEWKSLL